MRYLSLIILAAIFAGCSPDYKDYRTEVIDCSNKSAITLKARPEEKNTNVLYLHFEGEVDGNLSISIANPGNIFFQENLSGNVDLNFSNAWQYNTCHISCYPENVKQGLIKIYYEFK